MGMGKRKTKTEIVIQDMAILEEAEGMREIYTRVLVAAREGEPLDPRQVAMLYLCRVGKPDVAIQLDEERGDGDGLLFTLNEMRAYHLLGLLKEDEWLALRLYQVEGLKLQEVPFTAVQRRNIKRAGFDVAVYEGAMLTGEGPGKQKHRGRGKGSEGGPWRVQ